MIFYWVEFRRSKININLTISLFTKNISTARETDMKKNCYILYHAVAAVKPNYYSSNQGQRTIFYSLNIFWLEIINNNTKADKSMNKLFKM